MDMTWFEQMEARIPKGEVRTRFAPSPTGYMHVGNLRTALYTWLIARHNGGKFILRIEDTDQERLVEGAVDVIYRTMAECGLDHDEGPDVGGPVGPYVQTERRELYGKYADLLIEKGHAYRCFCEKQEETEGFEKAADPCRCLSREESDAKAAAGEPFVVRQRIPGEGSTTFHDEIFGDITVENSTLDDQVLIKRDGLPTYNFANVIDDHLMGITHVVRGSEYLSSSPKYNLLYEGFGWDIPAYVHCSPVMRDAHNKMSKRHGDPSYEDLIAQGYLTDAVVNYVALLGWSPGGEREIFSMQELAEIFDIKGISKSPAIFDIEKLKYFNAEYIRAMSPEAFAEAVVQDRFVEWEEVYKGTCYGTLRSEVERIWAKGHVIVFDVDVMGGLNLKRIFGADACSIFIMPPSIEELRRRLVGRATDAPEVIERRVAKAEFELTKAPGFDHVVVNDVLEDAVRETTRIVEQFIAC